MIYLKRHSTDHGYVVAMCDKEIMGKVLHSGKIEIDLKKYASFYKGELMSEERASSLVKDEELYTANVVGERSVKIMIDKGIVSEEDVKKAGKVPFVQIFKLDVS
jgi:uncharacterized protein